jgi:hypothetical protein
VDLRPIQRVNSVLVAGVLLFAVGFPGLVFSVSALALADSAWPGLCLIATTVVATPITWVLMLSLMRWSRAGRAPALLDAVAAEVGGQVHRPGWMTSLISPHLVGELDDARFRLTLRRQAGILSPATVGKKLAIWGWMYELELDAPTPARIGYGPAGHTALVGLFGLKSPHPLDDLTAYTGGTPDGKERVLRPAAVEAARKLVHFDGPTLVRVGTDAIRLSGTLKGPIDAAKLVSLIRDTSTLSTAITGPPKG